LNFGRPGKWIDETRVQCVYVGGWNREVNWWNKGSVRVCVGGDYKLGNPHSYLRLGKSTVKFSVLPVVQNTRWKPHWNRGKALRM
jgi:hypothetical protein